MAEQRYNSQQRLLESITNKVVPPVKDDAVSDDDTVPEDDPTQEPESGD